MSHSVSPTGTTVPTTCQPWCNNHYYGTRSHPEDGFCASAQAEVGPFYLRLVNGNAADETRISMFDEELTLAEAGQLSGALHGLVEQGTTADPGPTMKMLDIVREAMGFTDEEFAAVTGTTAERLEELRSGAPAMSSELNTLASGAGTILAAPR